MPSPEEVPAASTRPTTIPNLALGYVLNILMAGAGFTYIGRWGWHLGWLGIICTLNFVVLVMAYLEWISSLGQLLAPAVIVTAAMLVHFRRVYFEQERRDFYPPLSLAIKRALILAHVLLSLSLIWYVVFVADVSYTPDRAVSTP